MLYDVTDRIPPMVMGEQGLDDSQNQNIGTIQQLKTGGPTSESLELMSQ